MQNIIEMERNTMEMVNLLHGRDRDRDRDRDRNENQNENGSSIIAIVTQKLAETAELLARVDGKRKRKAKKKKKNKANAEKKKKEEEEIEEEEKMEWIEKMRSSMMVVASLTATMAFQVGVNPTSHFKYWEGGGALFAGAVEFYNINTASFIASLSIILLLMSGLPLNHRIYVWILTVITWVAISGICLTYYQALLAQTPPPTKNGITSYTFGTTVMCWICLVTLILLLHTLSMLYAMFHFLLRRMRMRIPRRPSFIPL